MRMATATHAAVYRASRGRLMSHLGDMPVMLLTTTGRKTGKPRTTPITYLEDEGRFVLTASNGGNDWYPAWYHNLKAKPTATVQVGSRRMQVSARVATPEERERLWARLVEAFSGYAQYEKKTKRPIPMVFLTPEI